MSISRNTMAELYEAIVEDGLYLSLSRLKKKLISIVNPIKDSGCELKKTEYADDKIIQRKIESIGGETKVSFYIHCIESLGDVIACEPISRYLKSILPDCKVYWIIKTDYGDVVRYNPYVDEVITVGCLSESIDIINDKSKESGSIIIDCHHDGRICSRTGRVHSNTNNPQINRRTYLKYGPLLTSSSLIAGLPALNMQPEFHLKNNVCVEGLPDKYVVIHCKSADAVKDWRPNKWNLLVSKITNEKISVVEIGLESVVKSHSNYYHDCTNIHDLQKIASIIKNATVFIGIDSAFAHIANCFMIKGIVLMGRYSILEKPNMFTGYYSENAILYAEDGLPVQYIKSNTVFESLMKKLNDTDS